MFQSTLFSFPPNMATVTVISAAAFFCIDIFAAVKIILLAKRPDAKKSPIRITYPAPNNNKVYFLDYFAPSRIPFKFRYVYINESWRAYILNAVDYRNKNASVSITHRHFDIVSGLYYVCWNAPVKKLEDMVAISRKWADATVEYIKTAKRF